MAFAPGLSAYFASYALGYGSAGAVAGGSAGFISGFGISVSWGASFTDALKQGGIGAVVGMAGGGVGGLVGGAAMGASGDAFLQAVSSRAFGAGTSSAIRASLSGESIGLNAAKGLLIGLVAGGFGAMYHEKTQEGYRLRQDASTLPDGHNNWGKEVKDGRIPGFWDEKGTLSKV